MHILGYGTGDARTQYTRPHVEGVKICTSQPGLLALPLYQCLHLPLIHTLPGLGSANSSLAKEQG